MKKDSYIRSKLDKMIADGISEEMALDFMIYVWLTQMGGNVND